MPRGEAKLLECVVCSAEYTIRDVQKERYFPQTRVCRKCYKKMTSSHPKIWCFGKVASSKLPGYSLDNEICQKVCPDKTICEMFVNLQRK